MAMTDVKSLFVDTNILSYATNTISPWYQAARERLQEAHDGDIELIISPQIIREYLAVATRSSVTTGSPSLSEILRNIQAFRTQFKLVQNTESVLNILIGLLRTIPTAGKQVHDANIVATMQAYGIQHLLTHNLGDFARFAQLITVIPLETTP